MAGTSQQNGNNKKKMERMDKEEEKGMRVQKARVYRESRQKKLNEEV